MVNFDNEATIGIPATDIEKVSILQRRYDVIEALEQFKQKKYNKINAPISPVRARLLSLFIELQATLKRRLGKKDYKKLRRAILSVDKEEALLNIIERINDVLDEIRLTRIDTQKVYNSQSVEDENKEKGF